MISAEDIDRLTEVCGRLPAARGNYLETDYIRNLFLTVLDFQMHGHAVENAIKYYMDHRFDEIRTLDDLQGVLSRHPDNKDGNTAVAQYLWGNRHWTRVGLLRLLVKFFRRRRVTNQAALKAWAARSAYDTDFKGKIRGMGLAIYNWLIMRQGIETVKPDVHLHRFAEKHIGRSLSDADVVAAFERVAKALSVKAYELDWRVWEHQRGAGLEFWTLEGAHVTQEEPKGVSPKRVIMNLIEQLPDDVDEDDMWRALRDRFPEAIARVTARPGNQELRKYIASL